MVCLGTPPHPSFTGGDEITEIPNSGPEKPIAEEIKRSENRLNQGDRDRGEGGRIAIQPEQQWKGQTDRETQITPSCEERRELTPPPLDLDGEVEMAGEGERRGEDNPNSGPGEIEAPPPPHPNPRERDNNT